MVNLKLKIIIAFIGMIGGGLFFGINNTVALTGPVDVFLSASPNPLDYNTQSYLSWTSSNSEYCVLYVNGSDTGWRGLSQSGVPTGNLTTVNTYTVDCINSGGGYGTYSVVINFKAPAPVCSGTHYNCSSGTAINGSESSTAYSWLCRNSDGVDASCSEAKSIPAPVCSGTHYNCSSGTPINGSESSTAYSWLCRNSAGIDASCSEAKPATGTIQITNSNTAFSYCVKKDGAQIFCDTRSMSFPGYDSGSSYSVTPSEQTGYTWTVSPAGGQTLSPSGTVPFSITYSPIPPTAKITCSPGNIAYGGSANISWTSTNAKSCTVSPTGWTGTSNEGTSTGSLYSSRTYSITCTGN